jgi:pimeloyl-ACP methyl ester carboxylesterase
MGKGRRSFEAEPGEPAFLIAPHSAETFAPDQCVTGPRASVRWANQVLEQLPNAETRKGRRADRRSGDVVFFIHGFNTTSTGAFRIHKKLSTALQEAGFPHAFVSFDWPSKGTVTNYIEDSLDAAKAAPALVETGIALFAGMSLPGCETRVHVIAHSMGAYVARTAFDFAPYNVTARQSGWMINQLVMIAADIGASSLAGDKSARMLAKAQRATNYFSGYDFALATSNAKRFLTSPRAGRWGTPEAMRSRIADVDCSPRYLALANDAKSPIDSHCWYFDDRAVFIPDLVETLRGNIDRRLIPRRRPDPVNPGRLLLE